MVIINQQIIYHRALCTLVLVGIIINQRGGRFKALISNNLPPSITHLTFGLDYNKPTNNLPQSITHLTFGEDYNQPTNNLPQSITHLTFDGDYNQPTNNLPQSITHLTFGGDYNQPTNNLPQSITHLTFGGNYNQPIIFPKHITSIIFYGKHEKYINKLYDLYELTHTNILDHNIINHIDKNKHNLNMKSLMLLVYCL